MLAPDSRAVLLEQLRPPSGCMFDEAVATTFTLDLSATLIPALAFSSFSYSGVIARSGCGPRVAPAGQRVDSTCSARPATSQFRSRRQTSWPSSSRWSTR